MGTTDEDAKKNNKETKLDFVSLVFLCQIKKRTFREDGISQNAPAGTNEQPRDVEYSTVVSKLKSTQTSICI